MTDFADDTSTEVERKAKALQVVVLVETVTYVVLAYLWLTDPNGVAKPIVGFLHGLVWMAFVAMTVLIAPGIRWSWRYVALVVLTGPVGGVLVFWRIRRDGVPNPYDTTAAAEVSPSVG